MLFAYAHFVSCHLADCGLPFLRVVWSLAVQSNLSSKRDVDKDPTYCFSPFLFWRSPVAEPPFCTLNSPSFVGREPLTSPLSCLNSVDEEGCRVRMEAFCEPYDFSLSIKRYSIFTPCPRENFLFASYRVPLTRERTGVRCLL